MGVVRLDNFDQQGSIGTGAQIGPFIDGRLEHTSDEDYTAGAGMLLGYNFQSWAVEGEYVYRYRTDWDVAAPTPSIQTVTNVFSNVETHTFVVQLIRRGELGPRWTWEAGIGAGYVKNNLETDYIERASGPTPQLTLETDSSTNDITFTAMAGVKRQWRGAWSMGLRYRYIDLGELEIGTVPGRNARLTAEHAAHEVQFQITRTL